MLVVAPLWLTLENVRDEFETEVIVVFVQMRVGVPVVQWLEGVPGAWVMVEQVTQKGRPRPPSCNNQDFLGTARRYLVTELQLVLRRD